MRHRERELPLIPDKADVDLATGSRQGHDLTALNPRHSAEAPSDFKPFVQAAYRHRHGDAQRLAGAQEVALLPIFPHPFRHYTGGPVVQRQQVFVLALDEGLDGRVLLTE